MMTMTSLHGTIAIIKTIAICEGERESKRQRDRYADTDREGGRDRQRSRDTETERHRELETDRQRQRKVKNTCTTNLHAASVGADMLMLPVLTVLKVMSCTVVLLRSVLQEAEGEVRRSSQALVSYNVLPPALDSARYVHKEI